MKRFSKLNEDISSFEEKITGKYKSLKRGTLELIDATINSSELVNYQNFINKYIDETDVVVDGFVEDNDIFDFYLKYKGDIDELLVDKGFFDKSARDNDIFSLYDYVIVGTKFGVTECMSIIQEDIF
jgi:hypothetical protein